MWWVGMIPFTKPGASEAYPRWAAARRAGAGRCRRRLRAVEQAYVGYVFGDSTAGQAAVYDVGLTGIPVVNVNNNCATGSTALFLARQAVASGAVPTARWRWASSRWCRGAEGRWTDRPSPLATSSSAMTRRDQGYDEAAPRAAQFFGGAARDYIKQHGIAKSTFARISVKARQHAARNPLAVFRQTVTLDEVLAAPSVFDPLTRLQCCPPTCGAAAAVVCSEDFAAATGWTPACASPRRP
jgi:acetyl-CoA acetyltransferase